jgi:hypothetical protein
MRAVMHAVMNSASRAVATYGLVSDQSRAFLEVRVSFQREAIILYFD